MTKVLPKLRVTLDDNGRPVVEKELSKGIFDVLADTQKVRKLSGDMLSLEETLRQKRPDFNPYNDAMITDKPLQKRNGLDYLRKLSDEIKRRRREDK